MRVLRSLMTIAVFVGISWVVLWSYAGLPEAFTLLIALGIPFHFMFFSRPRFTTVIVLALVCLLVVINPFLGILIGVVSFSVLSVNGAVYLLWMAFGLFRKKREGRVDNTIYSDTEFSSLKKAKELDFDPAFSLFDSNIHH